MTNQEFKEIVDAREIVDEEDGPCHLCQEDIQPGEEAVFTTVDAPGTKWHGEARVYHADCWIEDDI